MENWGRGGSSRRESRTPGTPSTPAAQQALRNHVEHCRSVMDLIDPDIIILQHKFT